MFENEIWKAIKDYDGLYEVSSYGRIRSLKRKAARILKPTPNKNGYLQICLCKNGTKKNLKIHRLVADAFIPNPDNKLTVDHIDRNPLNNSVENLRWADHSEQAVNRAKKWEHCIETKLQVLCVERNEKFDNSAAAAHWIAEAGLSNSKTSNIARQLRNVCKNTYGCKTAYGYHWEFYYNGGDIDELTNKKETIES